ncbi:fibrinogen alpha chain isoform X1 [Microcaecilia unicolor]|uniref:Fibrinogen alpha chain isoform X1 n=1 Tax=Microcaecilia unicolor TaxID=1415580 RepID=A0A6P7WWA5_9AMPH|nr:fibrinogen alpha chain isoform X1 [Microcaecilia unicolor]
MLQAKGLCFLLCLAGAVWAADEETDFSLAGATGRGPRIVEHGAQSSCLQEKSWPFCSDEDWGPKCPSGCRMKGLIDQTDRNFGKRMDFIRKQLIDNQNNYKSTDVTTKEIQQMIKDKLTQGQDGDNAFGTTAEELRRRIELLKQTVVRNVNRIINLQSSIQNQVVEMKRLEVDIDIKIRACKGSCSQGYNYNVDTESYDTIQKSFQQAGAINLDPSISQSNSLSVLKMRPVKDTLVAEHFKSLPKTGPDTQFNIFADIQQKAMVLERQGKEVKVPFVDPFIPTPSSTFPGSKVSVTKVDGGQPTGIGIEKQIFTGGEDKSTTTFTSHGRTVKCTKTITKKIIHGPSGPREELVETVSGGEGDECAHLLTKLGTDPASGVAYNIRVTSSDGLGDISKFPSFEEFLSGGAGSSFHSSSSSSSSSSKNIAFPDKSGTKVTHHDAVSDLGESGLDDFSRIHLGTPTFHSESFYSPGESSSYTKTEVVSSSSSKSSPFETKSMKSGFIPEDLRAVQQDQADSVTWTDCDDIHQKHVSGAKSGIFRIRPEGSNNVLSVYCDQDTVFGGWLLIQQRENGSVNFNRTWQDYKTGFGSVDAHGKGELWLGNEHIHLLTQKNTVLRVELEDWSGEEAYAEYSIQVRPESEDYALKVSQYVGTAGDALIQGSPEDEEYTSHNNMKFSTADRDSDQWEDNCAEVYGGGWWYNNCQGANLNGIYYMGGQYDPRNNVPYEIENGVVWLRFRTADYSLKTVRMKIRPRNLH